MTADWPWIAMPLLFLAYFAFFEVRAFVFPETKQDTLSAFIAGVSAKWPMFIALFGLVNGILLAHFFWAWPGNPLAGGG